MFEKVTHRVIAEPCDNIAGIDAEGFANPCPYYDAGCIVAYPADRGRAHQGGGDSHAPAALHIACRLNDAADCEDRTGDRPVIVSSRPMCIDCHVLFAHAPLHHHSTGLAPGRDGRVLLHRDHPRFDELVTHPSVEVHSGASYTECERCGPQAEACDGCRTVLAGS